MAGLLTFPGAGKSLVVWTEDEHMVQLRKAMQEAPAECLLDVPISLYNVLFKHEDDESNKRKGSSDLPPADDQKKMRKGAGNSDKVPSGRRKAAMGNSSSTKEQQAHLAPATRALADQLEVPIRWTSCVLPGAANLRASMASFCN